MPASAKYRTAQRQHDHVVAFIELVPNTLLRWVCSTWPSLARRLLPAGAPPEADAVSQAAFTTMARVLMNLDEFITRE